MKKTVETKFDVGDIVYVADHYYDFYAQKKPYIIKDIVINITSSNTHIKYEVEQDSVIDRVPEEWIFETYTECTKWCEEHN
jgi:hypothetical protein